MRSTPLLLEAAAVGDHRVQVRFEDGVAAVVDLGYLREFGGVFLPLREREFFTRLAVDPVFGTIVWPNDADIAPETLYELALEASAARSR